MSAERDIDRITAAYLADGPAELSDRVLEAALDEIHLTHQRRRPTTPWRNHPMSMTLRVAAVVAAIAVGGVALYSAFGRGPSIGATVTPPPSILASPAPSAASPVPSTASPAASPSLAAGVLAPLGYAGAGTIAFTRNDPALGRDAPFLVDPSGANEARVNIQHGWAGATSVPQTGCCVVFSPDGMRFAVGYAEQNPSRGEGTLYAVQVFGLDGTGLSMVPAFCGGCASIKGVSYIPWAWSANGGLVAVEVRSDSDPTKDGINVAPMDGAQAVDWDTQVTGAHEDTPLAFSPDGTRLLFVRRTTDSGGGIWVVTLATKAAHRLSRAGEVVFADHYLGPGASWSPDGTRVAYAATDRTGSTAQMRVYVVDAAGGTPAPITPLSDYSTSAVWSPDGTWIAFDRDLGGGHHHVFIVHPDGTGDRDLMQDSALGACCPHWAPDGAAVVAPGTASTDDQSDLIVLPLDGSGIRQVTTQPALYKDVSWGAASR
jgi:hypothetical protein